MYATIIVSQPANTDKKRQTIIMPDGTGHYAWTRLTNGKQGRGNAWLDGTPMEREEDISNDVLHCAPISVKITNRDLLDLQQRGTPSTLFTKLVRSVPLDPTIVEPADVADVIKDIENRSVDNPESLAEFVAPIVVVREETVKEAQQSVGFVPSFKQVGHYVQRTFCDIQEVQMYDFALEHKMNLLFEGPAGSGKTTSAMWYAMLNNLPYYSVQCSMELVASMLWGQQKQNHKTGKWEWVDGAVTDIVRNGGVLVFDEITSADPRTLMNLNSLLDDRRMLVLDENNGEVVTAHPNLLIVAAYNPNYRGTRPMNEALKDRFDIKVVYDYDAHIESQIITSSALLDLAKRMRRMSNTTFSTSAGNGETAFETPISPRLLKAFEKIATGLSYDFAVEVFVNNFSDEERSSVRMLMGALDYNLKSDLGLFNEDIVTENPVEA